MKRTILITIVLFAAIGVIYYMVMGWQKDRQSEVAHSNQEEREVFGMSASGQAASSRATDVEEDIGAEAAAAAASEGAVDFSELESRSRDYTEKIVKGMTGEVLKDASDTLKKQTTADDLNLSFESVTSDLGSYVGIESATEGKADSYREVTVTLRYEGNDGASIRFVYDKKARLAGIWFDNTKLAASVTKGSRYEEKLIKIGRNPYVLEGKLTLPIQDTQDTGRDKPPVVILISDRNDADMDGSIGSAGNTPLRDVAHGLALRGVASIRYNKRLSQYPDTADAGAGIREYLIKDAWMAIDNAGYMNTIDTDAIFVMAWGEAAEYLPVIVEQRSRRLAGAILVGAKPVKHEDMSYLDEATKVTSDAKYFSVKNTSLPLMFMQGEKDFETPVKCFERWQSLLTGRVNTAYHLYKQLGHYLFAGSSDPSGRDYDVKDSVSNSCIGDVANWCAGIKK
ncbi:MAG: DUF3887 domain-containing protein [Eubacterium sp.]|nr:DUF3887 domain-containing protein [Eubacterium sp.]